MRITLLTVVALTTVALCQAADLECKYRKARKQPLHWADPTNCSRFYRCTNKGIKREIVCPDDKEYNSKTGKCSSGGRGLCKLSFIKPLADNDNVCADQVSGAYMPEAGFCRNFYICNDQKAYKQVCDVGSLFDPTTTNCVPDTGCKCWQNKCIGVADNTYLPNPTSCNSFLVCNDGDAALQECEAGSYYNQNDKSCQPDPSGDLCWENLCVGKNDGTYVKNKDDCHNFYICSGGKPVAQECPEGSYFDWEDNNCKPGECPPDETTEACTTTTTECSSSTETTTCTPETTTECSSSTETTTCTEETTTECSASTETTTCTEETTTECSSSTETTTCSEETTTECSTSTEETTTECSSSTETTTCSEETTTECSTPTETTTCSEETTTECSTSTETTTCSEETTTECSSSSETTPCTDETTTECAICPGGAQEGDFLPYPGNCMLYYVCSESRLVEESCGTGNYFDATEKICTRDTNGVCPQCQTETRRGKRSIDEVAENSVAENSASIGEPNCFGIYQNGELVKHPKDCRRFLICFDGELTQHDCGVGNYFNSMTRSCEIDTQRVCTPTENFMNLAAQTAIQHDAKVALADEEDCTCPGGYANGTLLPFPNYPENCNKYYVCSNRRLVEQDCGAGNMFDSTIDVCVPDTDNQCWPGDPCKNQADNTVMPTPGNCTQFYLCENGAGELHDCPPSRWFNPAVGICEPDVTGNCVNPCAGTTGIEFLPHPDCKKYFLCNDGVPHVENCTTGGFDVTLGYCHKDAVCEATLCVGKDDGVTYSVVGDDTKFYLCLGGVAYIYNCEEGSAYQPSVGVCLEVPSSDCNQSKCNSTYPEDNAFPPISTEDDTAFCYCRDGGAFLSHCSNGYTFDAALGICYSNAPCDPEICDVLPENSRSPNRNDSHSFCLCVMKQPVIVNCPDNATYDPMNQLCQPTPTVDPNCSPAYCLNKPDYTIFGALDNNTNGFCMCMGTGATYTPCESGKKFNAEKGICLSSEVGGDCNSASCANNIGLIFGVTGDPTAFCYCVSDTVAIKQNCPNSETFNNQLLICQAVGCDVNFCQTNPGPFPVPNDPYAFCYCQNNSTVTKISCPEGKAFDPSNLICRADPCNKNLCSNPASNGNAYPANNIPDGFCVCQGGVPVFHVCNDGYQFEPTLGICVSPADLSCNLALCANATTENGYPVPSKDDPHSFCYCFSPTVVEVFQCPNNGIFEPALGICSAGNGPVEPTEPSNPGGSDCTCPGGYTQGQLLPYPNNCQLYYVCDQGRLREYDCGAGNFFDEYTGTCQPDTNGVCSPTTACTCVGAYREGQFLAHPTDDRMYYVCQNAQLNERDCGAGNFFNRVTAICEPRNKYNQQSAQSRLMRSAAADPDMPQDDKDMCVNNEKHSVPSNCSQYEVCVDGIWMRRTCPFERYYNPEQRKCLEPRDDTVCAHARVKGLPLCLNNGTMEQQTVPGKGMNCAQYYRCSNGKWRLKACPKQHFYSRKWRTCLASTRTNVCIARNETENAIIATTLAPSISPNQTQNWTNALEIAPQASQCKHTAMRHYASNCAMYLMCLEGEWWYQYCPLGMYFNRITNYCIPNTEGQCAAAASAALSSDTQELLEFTTQSCKEEGAVRASALACDSYYECKGGTWKSQRCSAGHYFNVTIGACLLDKDGNCAQLTLAGCVDEARREFPLNCTAYELCVRGTWQRASCGATEAYDNVLNRCAPNDGHCAPNGLRRTCRAAESRPLPFAENCTQFYYCQNDSWQIGACLKGHTYIEKEQLCAPHALHDRCQALWNVTQSNAVDFSDFSDGGDSPCLGISDGTAVPHPENCRRFFLCFAEEATNEQECVRGSYFDAELGYCRPNDGRCRVPLTGVCASATDGGYVSHPDDCRSYYHCSTQNGSQLLHCSEGEYYSNETNQCRVDHGECRQHLLEAKCATSAQHGARLPHERYCNIYYACVSGLAIPVECPDEHRFSVATGHCVYDELHECEDGVLVEHNNNSSSYSCGNLTDGTHLPDRIDCTRFYVCSAGVALPKRCANGAYFDSQQLLCIPDDGSCPYVDEEEPNHQPPDPALCEGKHGHMMPDSANCNEFYVCINGKLFHERCHTDHYFNATIQQCQPYKRENVAAAAASSAMMDDAVHNATEVTARTVAKLEQCTDKPTDNTKICSQVPKGTTIAEQGDCRRYISCEEDVPISQRCRNGESYDSILRFCRQNDGTCLLENGQRVGECNGRHGQLVRDGSSCRGYFVCINGQKISAECSGDEYFDRNQGMCSKDENNQCDAATGKLMEIQSMTCTGLSETALYPYVQDNCRSYFQCIQGIPKVHECADGLYYNTTTTRCVKEITECVMPAATTKRAPEITYSKQKICDDAEIGQRYANIDDHCRSYYVCDAESNVSYTTCPSGELYDSQSDACELARNVVCRTRLI